MGIRAMAVPVMGTAALLLLMISCAMATSTSQATSSMRLGAASTGVVRRVGEDNGWVVGVVNYTLWTSTYTFHVGDFLEFNYLREFHNVLEVTEASYTRCHASNAMSLHTDGKTRIQLKEPKTYYFICGVVNHCSLGQKLHVLVLSTLSSPPKGLIPMPTPHHPPAFPPTPLLTSSCFNHVLCKITNLTFLILVVVLI
ncbi:hypothetical protein L7F22_027507 [Adiantum nelumboides]|nr:hypothetical protein [Adiantum nelumboides]